MARYAKFFSVGGGGGGTNNLQLPVGTILDTTLRQVQDGLGTGSPLYLSTYRVGITSDASVTTQTSSVIQATTLNSSLVIAPNGTGALVAQIPDGTATGGDARGQRAVDLQMSRAANYHVAGGNYSVITGGISNGASGTGSAVLGGMFNFSSGIAAMSFGESSSAGGGRSIAGGYQAVTSANYAVCFGNTNTASSQNSTVSGGQSNTASTNTHATVVGGSSNTSSGLRSISGGNSNVASASNSIALGGQGNVASGDRSVALGGFSNSATIDYAVTLGGLACQSTKEYAVSFGNRTRGYLLGQLAFSGGNFELAGGQCQQSFLTPYKEDALTTGATTVLSLDGSGVTNLIIPSGSNRAWNVQVNWVAVVTTITGTATGVTVGDIITGESLFGFKKIGGVSSVRSFIRDSQGADTAIMDTCSLAYSAGASQELAMTFTGPTFAGGGSVTMRVVAKVELVEVAY